MKRIVLIAIFLMGFPMAVVANELIKVSTNKSVAEAADALEAAVAGAGATLFARIDHRTGAEAAGLEMDYAETLIFGNPKLGTPAMLQDPRASLYLPLKVAIYAAPEGGVFLTYEDPAEMLGDLDVPADAEYIKMMQGALAKLTAAAAG